MHRQLYSVDDFCDRTIATVLRDAAVSRDDCARCVGPALLAGFDDRFRALPDTPQGARQAQWLMRDGAAMITTLYQTIGARHRDTVVGLATVCANSATYLTPALIDAVIRTADSLAPWMDTVLEYDAADSGLRPEAWEALGAAAILRLCDSPDADAPDERSDREGAAAILLQLTAAGEATHRWPVWRARLFAECDARLQVGCREAAAVLLAGGLTFAPVTGEEYVRLLPSVVRYSGWLTAILRHPLLEDASVAASAAAVLIDAAQRQAAASGHEAPDAEAMRAWLCDRHLRLASDHPLVLATAAAFVEPDPADAPTGDAPATSVTRRVRKPNPITYHPR